MQAKHATLYSTAVFLASLATVPTSHALDTGKLTQSRDLVEQQVERQAERQLERSIERQAERSSLKPPEARLRARLPDLPERIPILSADGSEAFADVRVEDDWRAVEKQWLIMLDGSELDQLDQPGIHIIDQTRLREIGLNVVRFRVDNELDSREALKRLLPDSLGDRLDRNHIYRPQSNSGTNGSQLAPGPACENKLSVGMVDTAIHTDHPGFSKADIVQKDFLADTELGESFQEPEAHGTAVASLLVGEFPDQTSSRLPGATLVNASVFYSRDELASGATLTHLVEGLNWLVSQKVSLINISMAGPDNRLLAAVTERVSEAGVPMVAAVGNQGPASSPLFPAAYPHVVGVTAVDDDHQVYRWANQGDQVDFAAYGVDVPVASTDDTLGSQSGTSMAAPLVTARLACAIADNPAPLPDLIERLAEQAVDLGKTGRDPVYGHGLLEEE